ncbi:MAG: Spy/CpxP family protein refolding chaperone [Alphaproteobacteria bacterium]|nr:Spy/CpxP family protein refolding chaperone [Alphaproteobacteria bacterium]
MVSVKTNARAWAAAALLGTALLAGPGLAQTSPQPQSPAAQAPARTKVAPGSGAQAARTYSTPERVEARIQDLHSKLAITQAQEPQWRQLAQTMRENAQAVESKAAEREKALQTMTVMDDLRSYEALAKVHAETMTKLVASFEPLYTAMSPEQKKRADAEFQGYRKRASNTQTQ